LVSQTLEHSDAWVVSLTQFGINFQPGHLEPVKMDSPMEVPLASTWHQLSTCEDGLPNGTLQTAFGPQTTVLAIAIS
jgi:hypothetical protein